MGRPDRRRPSYWKMGGVSAALLIGVGTAAKFGAFGSDARYFANKALDKFLNNKDEPPFPPASTGGAAGIPSGTSGTSGGASEFVSTEYLTEGIGLALIVGLIAYQLVRPRSQEVAA